MPAAADVSVRRARREDWPRMVELDRQLARFEKLPEPTEAESARLGALIFDERRIEALVAERNGVVEGMAIFWEGLGSSFRARPFLFLEDLVVSESARSAGIGDALMRELAREGVRRGVMRVEWSVLDWNVNAIRFYRRIGGGPQQDWVRYELKEEAMRRLAEST
jgi:ribosomal protein S18 acetylase RimI-like enzyme